MAFNRHEIKKKIDAQLDWSYENERVLQKIVRSALFTLTDAILDEVEIYVTHELQSKKEKK